MKSAIQIATTFIATIEALQTVPGMHASYDREREAVCRELLRIAGALRELRRAESVYEDSEDQSTDYQDVRRANDELRFITDEIMKEMGWP